MRELKEQIRECVVKQTNLVKDISDEEIKQLIDGEIFKREECRGIAVWDKIQLHRDIFNSLRGLDVLQDLVEDSSITEIMINGVEDIFIEQAGKIHRLDKQFSSKEKLEDVVQQIVSKANRIVNEASPIVDTRLEDGSRVNIVLPPVALNNGPIVTIRKFPEKAIDMDQLIALNSITEEAARFMEQLVKAGMNIFISGGTGSGKTTFLNILSNAIPKDERIITIEDSAELQIRKIPNLVKLETRNANVEGKNAITIRELIKCALRMRPERIKTKKRRLNLNMKCLTIVYAFFKKFLQQPVYFVIISIIYIINYITNHFIFRFFIAPCLLTFFLVSGYF